MSTTQEPSGALRIPPLPDRLAAIAIDRCYEPQNQTAISAEIDGHCAALLDYRERLEVEIKDTINAKNTDGSRSGGLRRHLQNTYSVEGLREQVADLLYVIQRMEMPPSETLLALIRAMDRAVREDNTFLMAKAVALSLQANPEVPISTAKLAAELGISFDTLKGWMRGGRWSELESDQKTPDARPLYIGPLKDDDPRTVRLLEDLRRARKLPPYIAPGR